ncbi:MAG: hypothetical protein Q8N60_00095, partial [Candidatus Diapherotrites archaeon]|nr:hypothetical protein [Candidatus Diapherotrites archaeon]
MNPKRRQRVRQIRQRQLRRKKNVSFKQLSPIEPGKIEESKKKMKRDPWANIKGELLDADSLFEVEQIHNVKFMP